MARILVVDDDPDVLGTTARALSREGYEVDVAGSAEQALKQLEKQHPDLIMLDIMMPKMNGLELCRELRAKPEHAARPILFLSALGQTDDVVEGLDAGGDDYIVKPFELAELSARVRALLRRVIDQDDHKPEPLNTSGLKLHPRTFKVEGDRGIEQLSATEFRLLHYLMSHAGEVHSISALLENVWSYPLGSGDPNLVRAHIRNIRRKIETDPSNPKHVETIHGVGYIVMGKKKEEKEEKDSDAT